MSAFNEIHSLFEEGLRLPAASSVKRIRVDTPIPIALHITSEPVPLFLQRFGTWPSSGNSNEYRGSHTRAVYTQSVAPKKMLHVLLLCGFHGIHCCYLTLAKCRNVVKITELVRM